MDITVERDIVCPTRDGVALRSDIYRPARTSGPVPVLLTRTPYNKTRPLNADNCAALARRGFIAVTQDIRGTHASDGDYDWKWNPPSQERESRDGFDAVAWAAALPGSDGRVGTFGVSYMSYNQLITATRKPPALKAMHLGGMTVTSLDMNFGIFDAGRRLQWIYAQAADQRKRGGRTDGPLTREEANVEWTDVMQGKWLWHLPLNTIPDHVFDSLSGPYRDFLEIQNTSPMQLGDLHDWLDIPVCNATGWWDRLSLCVRHNELLQERGLESVKDRHRLIVGPWSHDPSTFRRDIGPRDYGAAADYVYPDLVADWFDEVFHGRAPAHPATAGRTNLYLVNEDTWRSFDTWPPAEAVETSFHLHSGGAANSVYGDGTLSTQPAGNEPPDHYDYDPADPFMSLMGRNSHHLPVDQHPNDHRRDNLVYLTPPLEEDIVVAGYPRVELWAASDAPDTDFAVKLIEIGPDGLALNIAQGIIRARYRNGYDQPALLTPGEVVRYTIGLMPAGIRFRKGSRIRLDIASSDFPSFDRNHNTGGRDWAESDLRIAHQTVFHDAERASRLILPVLPA